MFIRQPSKFIEKLYTEMTVNTNLVYNTIAGLYSAVNFLMVNKLLDV